MPRMPASLVTRSNSCTASAGSCIGSMASPTKRSGYRSCGVVERLAQLEPEGGRRPERHRLRERERMHGHAGLVHRFKPGVDVDVLRLERDRQIGDRSGEMTARIAADLGAVGIALTLQKRDPFRRIPVGMYVDDANARRLRRILRSSAEGTA